MPSSHRTTGVLPRMPIRTTTAPMPTLNQMRFSDELIAQLAAVWQADLLALRRELRPWYIRFWDWAHGQ